MQKSLKNNYYEREKHAEFDIRSVLASLELKYLEVALRIKLFSFLRILVITIRNILILNL
jgi:hypothetical protein